MIARVVRVWLMAVLLAFTAQAHAQVDQNAAPLVFNSAAEEARFHALASELRCVMCQNQSLADSNALIARDLRAEVLSLIRSGKTDAEIKTFLVQRYGEFVLYRPQVSARTGFLWFGPLALLLAGAVVVFVVVRKRASSGVSQPDAQVEGEDEW